MFKIYFVCGGGKEEQWCHELDMGVLHTFADGYNSIVKRQSVFGTDIKRTGSFLDSGAFTFQKKPLTKEKKELYLSQYIDFINSEINNYQVYAQLDTICGADLSSENVRKTADATFENYQYMLEKVKDCSKLCMVYHCAVEPLDVLERLLSYKSNGKRAGVLGIAGAFRAPKEYKMRIFEKCFNVIMKSQYSDVKVHCLGVTQPEILTQFPFTSSDSATVVKMSAYGQILYWRPEHNIYTTIFLGKLSHVRKTGNFLQMPKKELEDFKAFVKDFGATVEELYEVRDAKTRFNFRVMKHFAETYKCNYKNIHIKTLF